LCPKNIIHTSTQKFRCDEVEELIAPLLVLSVNEKINIVHKHKRILSVRQPRDLVLWTGKNNNTINSR